MRMPKIEIKWHKCNPTKPLALLMCMNATKKSMFRDLINSTAYIYITVN